MELLDDVRDPLATLAADRLRARERRDPSAEFGCLATVDASGQPCARMVTLRTIDSSSVLVSAHRSGPKIEQLTHEPRFELVVYYQTLQRQYRLRGVSEWVPAVQVPELFAQAPWPSRVWNWMHEEWPQTSTAPTRAVMLARFHALTRELEAEAFTRASIAASPGAGYLRLCTTRVELQALDLELRLHDRREFVRADLGWNQRVLVP